MRYLSSKALVAFCLLASPALAQSRVDQLGAGAAVQGTDAVPNCQSCGSSTALVKTTLAQILTYIQANIVVPLTSGVSGILPVANGGSGTASPALVAGTNVTITGSWPNQTINASGGGGSSTGFGVDGGTAAVSLTASCVLGAGASCSSHSIRLVKIGTISGAITITLDAIANLSSDSEVCLDDQGGNITGTNTLTVTANAADSIANGSAGGSDGPFISVAGVCYRVTATHNWTRETSTIIPAFAASAHNFVTGLSALGAWSQAQPEFADLSGTIAAGQQNTPGASSLGAVNSKDCTSIGASDFVQKINTDGSITCAAPSGGGSLTVTDGTHTVTSTTQITFSGATVSGSTPNATVTGSGGGGISCPTNFTLSLGDCLWSQTASNSASLLFTGLTLNDYTLTCYALVPATNTSSALVQYGIGGTLQTSGYNVTLTANGAAPTKLTNQAGLFLGSNWSSSAVGGWGTSHFYGLASAISHQMDTTGGAVIADGTLAQYSAVGYFSTNTTTIDEIAVLMNSGNITSGTCVLRADGV